jgi:hypothetical protein
MGRFDFNKFNGFARKSLDDFIFKDLWNHDIFNERDMHAAAYYYIRQYFRKQGRGSVYVRCEPMLAEVKPDIVIYNEGHPIYVLEFKLFSQPDVIGQQRVQEDILKLADLVAGIPSIKWGFFHLIHDSDEQFGISDPRLRRAGLDKVSVTVVNARRKEESNRRRVGYDAWRKEFDRLQSGHRDHA